MTSPEPLDGGAYRELVRRALAEDLGWGDATTQAVVPAEARAVYEATLPAAQDDFEYYVTAETSAGTKLIWPPTAPKLSRTVVTTN